MYSVRIIQDSVLQADTGEELMCGDVFHLVVAVKKNSWHIVE